MDMKSMGSLYYENFVSITSTQVQLTHVVYKNIVIHVF